MINNTHESIIEEYNNYLSAKEFPCVAAKAALAKQQVKCIVAEHMACPKDDIAILQFLYDFIDGYRSSAHLFHSASIIFKGPEFINEDMFDRLLWQRLQSLANIDAQYYKHDKRVDQHPLSANFSFSIKEEAFFIIGLHPSSSRLARRFKYPTLAFNPHAQFENLRAANNYDKMKNIVRKRDIAFSGSVNPMLDDFGTSSEVYQYSGKIYDSTWKCPLNFNHESVGNNSPS